MPRVPNNLTQGMWSKLFSFFMTLLLLSGSAFAQNPMMPGISLQGEPKRPLTPEEQEKQQKLDDDYKAATKKISDHKQNDPWGDVRPTPPVKGQSKNESLTPYHRDSFNKQTPQ